MEIVYLDQNKWIELARVHSGAATSGTIAELYDQLTHAVGAGRVLFPLSVSHILETSKRNDLVSRGHVAETQAKFSLGYVYRSRGGRLYIEVRKVIGDLLGLNLPEMPPNWMITPGFLQAFEETDELVAELREAHLVRFINSQMDPAKHYVDYMKNQDDARRRLAHKVVLEHAGQLVEQLEKDRERLVGQSVDMRRRVHATRIFIEYRDFFIQVLNSLGCSFEQLDAIKERAVPALIEEVPTLNVEVNIVARIEAEAGRLKVNDLFDVQSCYTAIPYSSRFIAEKASISRAKQAGLGVKYSVALSSSLEDLIDVYSV